MELGKHIILELYDCDTKKLDDTSFLEQALRDAATSMGATILSSNFHPFAPIGVSGVVIIKESHLTIHTWPEYGYAAIDIFTCGDMDMQVGVDFLKNALSAQRFSYKTLVRGKGINPNS